MWIGVFIFSFYVYSNRVNDLFCLESCRLLCNIFLCFFFKPTLFVTLTLKAFTIRLSLLLWTGILITVHNCNESTYEAHDCHWQHGQGHNEDCICIYIYVFFLMKCPCVILKGPCQQKYYTEKTISDYLSKSYIQEICIQIGFY